MTDDLTPWLLLDRLIQAVSEDGGRTTRKPVMFSEADADINISAWVLRIAETTDWKRNLTNAAEAAIALQTRRNKTAAARRKQGKRIGKVAK